MVDGVRSVGLPTTAHQWRDIGTFGGIAAVAAALIGSLAGGAMGERWHTKVLARALDPSVGPEGRIRESADGAELGPPTPTRPPRPASTGPGRSAIATSTCETSPGRETRPTSPTPTRFAATPGCPVSTGRRTTSTCRWCARDTTA